MSNPRFSSWILVALAVLAAADAPRAAAEPNPFRAWTDFITAKERVYGGPTVPLPYQPRPEDGGFRLCSDLLPLCVHAGGTRVDGEVRLQRLLAALENAFAWLQADGWPLPYPDGLRGGSADFDVYLIERAARSTAAFADDTLATSLLDAATTFALLDAGLPDDELERCALDALAQAGITGHDPAEAEGTRRAFAAFATYRAHGEFGCEDAVQDAQRAPHLGVLGDGEREVASAALLLAMISRRHDRDSGRFVRGALELARQRSKSPAALHARPDAWQALSAMLERAGESLDRAAEEFAVARHVDARESGPLPAVPVSAAAAARWGPPLGELPEHVPPREPGLATYGSAYLRLDTSRASSDSQLRIWLRGEPGVRWALTAVRLSARGRELGQMSAPPRRVPESFLPVLLEDGTEELLLVITKLPLDGLPLPAADDGDVHYFKLILDR